MCGLLIYDPLSRLRTDRQSYQEHRDGRWETSDLGVGWVSLKDYYQSPPPFFLHGRLGSVSLPRP